NRKERNARNCSKNQGTPNASRSAHTRTAKQKNSDHERAQIRVDNGSQRTLGPDRNVKADASLDHHQESGQDKSADNPSRIDSTQKRQQAQNGQPRQNDQPQSRQSRRQQTKYDLTARQGRGQKQIQIAPLPFFHDGRRRVNRRQQKRGSDQQHHER